MESRGSWNLKTRNDEFTTERDGVGRMETRNTCFVRTLIPGMSLSPGSCLIIRNTQMDRRAFHSNSKPLVTHEKPT